MTDSFQNFQNRLATRSPLGMVGSSQNWALRLRGLFQDCTQPCDRSPFIAAGEMSDNRNPDPSAVYFC
jgi:hypothetical protein